MSKKKRNTFFPKELTTITPVSKALAFLLALALPFIGFLFGISYQRPVDNESVSLIAVPSISPQIPAANDTATWKVYSKKVQGYGFSFKHPKDWSVFFTPARVIFSIVTPQTQAQIDTANAKNTGYYGSDITLHLRSLDLDAERQDPAKTFQKMTIGGQEWYRYVYNNNANFQNYNIYYVIYTPDKKAVWEFSFDPTITKVTGSGLTEKQVQLLISTFKITN